MSDDSWKLQRLGEFMVAQLDDQSLLTPMQSLSLFKMMQEAIGDLDWGTTLAWCAYEGGASPGWPQDYHEPALEITIKDESVKVVDLAHWVRNAMPSYTGTQSMMVARALLKDETWRPPFDEFKIGIHNPWCLISLKNEHGYESERFI